MNKKNNLTLGERIQFVNEVVNLSERDGQYDPALYDYAFRIVSVAYFTDTDVNALTQEQLSDLAFSEETNKMMNEVPRKYILGTLNKACREKIEIARQQYLALYEAAAKNQPWTELVQLFSDLANELQKQLNVKDMIKTISEENAKLPVAKSKPELKVATAESTATESAVANSAAKE